MAPALASLSRLRHLDLSFSELDASGAQALAAVATVRVGGRRPSSTHAGQRLMLLIHTAWQLLMTCFRLLSACFTC
jgi:hypothetical protein